MYKLKNGQYKDFSCLYCAWIEKYGNNFIADRIMSASITSGLINLSKIKERNAMYDVKNDWLKIINLLELVK